MLQELMDLITAGDLPHTEHVLSTFVAARAL
jgi:hypothetical protein